MPTLAAAGLLALGCSTGPAAPGPAAGEPPASSGATVTEYATFAAG